MPIRRRTRPPRHSFPRAQSLRHDVSLHGDIPEMLSTTSPTLKSVEAVIGETEPTAHLLVIAAKACTPCHRDARWASCASCGTASRVVGVQRHADARCHDAQHPL